MGSCVLYLQRLSMDTFSIRSVIVDRWNLLAREQKISAVVLVICGMLAIFLSAQRITSTVSDPFTVSKAKLLAARKTIDAIDPSKRLEEESKRRDTDGDGISDYDEEKLFGTSPYLRDTDGDGAPDNVELALGQNPNCPTGQTCATSAIDVSALASSSNPFLGVGGQNSSGDSLFAAFQRGVNQSKASLVQTGNTSTVLEQGLVRDPAEIRKVLRDSGKVDLQLLDKLTDAQLLELYDKALTQAARQKVEAETGITDPTKYPTPDPSFQP